ncbi:MAG: glycosyltransferase family 39 protein [Nanoarchaeota archaeon]
MDKELKKVLILYAILVIIKLLLSLFIASPSIFGDEYGYAKLGWSIYHNQEYSVHNILVNTPMPLYPMVLSLTYVFHNMNIVYFFMKLLNILILSFTAIPIYFLARKFLEKKDSIIITSILMITPIMFNTNFYLMAENLFYPLFVLYIYFLYESFTKENKKNSIISGVFLGLLFLTRIISGFIVPTFFITYLFFRKKSMIKNVIIHYISSLIIILPWFIRNGINYGFTIKGLLGQYSTVITDVTSSGTILLPFINWFIIYFAYLILSTGVIFPIYYALSYKIEDQNYKLLLFISSIIILFLIICGANESASLRIFYDTPFKLFTRRPIGRYLDPAILLILLNGFIAYKKLDISKKLFLKISLIFSAILLIGTQLIIAPLLPFNNQSLTLFGGMNYALHSLYGIGQETFSWTIFIFFAIMFLIFGLLYNIEYFKKRATLFTTIFLILSTIFAFSATAKVSYDWNNSEQMQLSRYIGHNYNGKIMFDIDDCNERISKDDYLVLCEKSKKNSIIGFWINSDITIDNIENAGNYDYILSTKKLDNKIIKDIKGKLFFYESR